VEGERHRRFAADPLRPKVDGPLMVEMLKGSGVLECRAPEAYRLPMLGLSPVLMLTILVLPQTAMAQSSCRRSIKNEWLQRPIASQRGAEIESANVLPVNKNIVEATATLDDRHFVALAVSDLRKFVEGPLHTPSHTGRSRPYLVRAVFPAAAPSLHVRWSGSDLHVFAGGLGCAPFRKQPIIVFLHKKPANVYVMATSAV
jgi:hypothetical protein